MNNTLKMMLALVFLGSACSSGFAASNEAITNFLKHEEAQLSKTFPYRLNLPKNGQTAKNDAGIRIAEDAKQLFSDDVGQVFYYDLYDHAMRVPHWHANTHEVGVVLEGKMRITIFEGKRKSTVFTVEKNGTWSIPSASLHALENVGSGNLKFLVSYDVPNSADRDFATAWAALPDAMLESSVGLTPEEIKNIKKTTINRLSKYDPSAKIDNIDVGSPFAGSFDKTIPLIENSLGSIQRVDAHNTPKMGNMTLQKTVLKPGTMREPHWYIGGDDLLYVYKGTAFFTMMDNNGKIFNAIVHPGDLIFIPVGVFHSYLNTGTDDLEIYETMKHTGKTKQIHEITLLSGAQHFDAATMSAAIGISKTSAEKIIKKEPQQYLVEFK
mgnify:CR=1 FL=1